MNKERKKFLHLGLANLPGIPELFIPGRNGEALSTDEAAVWKRVLNYRLACHIKPRFILETHPGLAVSTQIYRVGAPESIIVKGLSNVKAGQEFNLIDIDPFGQPWDFLSLCTSLLPKDGVMQISNGEAMAVARNLKRAQRFPSHFYGKHMPKWVVFEYLPRLEYMTRLKVQYYYVFPTTIRVVLSARQLPNKIWKDCNQWMWWLQNYVPSVRK